MKRFKVGDKVKIIASKKELTKYGMPVEIKGEIAVINYDNGYSYYRIELDNKDSWLVRSRHIKLIKDSWLVKLLKKIGRRNGILKQKRYGKN